MSDKDLTIATADLARRSPEEWSKFLAAFRAHSNVRRDQCVSSPVEQLQVTQGRAQESVALLRIFETCLQAADRITEKRK